MKLLQTITGFFCSIFIAVGFVLTEVAEGAKSQNIRIGFHYPMTLATITSASTQQTSSIWSGFGLGVNASIGVFNQGLVRFSYEGNFGLVSRSILFTGIHAGLGYSLVGLRTRSESFPGGDAIFSFDPVISIISGVFRRSYDFSNYFVGNTNDEWSLPTNGSFAGIYFDLETVGNISSWGEAGFILRIEQTLAGPPEVDFRLYSAIIHAAIKL